MKFKTIREFITGDLTGWVMGELNAGIRDLFIGLRRLSFEDNFESFEFSGSIGASAEISITNKLPFIPSRYIVLDTTGGAVVGRGPTAWTSDRVFIRNYTATATVAKIVFLR